jgi:hypothetical protein
MMSYIFGGDYPWIFWVPSCGCYQCLDSDKSSNVRIGDDSAWQYQLCKLFLLLHFMYFNKLTYFLSWYHNSTALNPESRFRGIEVPPEALHWFTFFSRFTSSESHPELCPWIQSELSTLNTTAPLPPLLALSPCTSPPQPHLSSTSLCCRIQGELNFQHNWTSCGTKSAWLISLNSPMPAPWLNAT